MKKKSYSFKVILGMVAVGLFFVVVATIGYLIEPQGDTSDNLQSGDVESVQPNQELSEDEVVDFALDVLNTLHSFYFASIDSRTGNEDLIDVMVELKQWNKKFENGLLQLSEYVESGNEIIQIVVAGLYLGAQENIEANEMLLSFLENFDQGNPDITRMNALTAESISKRKDGYDLIVRSAPFVATLIYPLADSDNPTGVIPYKISLDSRMKVLNELERLFGEALEAETTLRQETGEYNAILLAVRNIRDNIKYETYEDFFNADKVQYPGEPIAYNLGSYSEHVEKVQLRLNELNYEVEVDGYFGNETKNEVIAFQRNNSLEPDGVVGETTWNYLFNNSGAREKVILPAYITIPDINTLSRASNNAYYINGTTSHNCDSITVVASNSSAGIYDSYTLTGYKKGDKTFKYGIREDWNNLGIGSNTYTFTAYCEGKQIKTVSTTLDYTVTQPVYDYSQTYIPSSYPSSGYNYYGSYDSYDEGYEWAEENDIDDFDDCQYEFGTGDAEDGCNEYVKEYHTGYRTFHGYDCTEDCSGHEAGYEWAEDNDIDDIYDCDGNSQSFIEGCEAYVDDYY